MNADALERLLIDGALGVLDPDVEELLAAYLSIEGDAVRAAAPIQNAVDLARDVLAADPAPRLPEFPARVAARDMRRRAGWALVRRAGALAAALVLGVGLGGYLFGGGAGAARQAPSVPAPPLVSFDPQFEPGRSPDGIWSARPALDASARRGRPEGPRVIWDSPIRRPQLGEMT